MTVQKEQPKPKQKMIEYSIASKQWFPTNEGVLELDDILEKLREYGEAEIVDVKIVEKDW